MEELARKAEDTKRTPAARKCHVSGVERDSRFHATPEADDPALFPGGDAPIAAAGGDDATPAGRPFARNESSNIAPNLRPLPVGVNGHWKPPSPSEWRCILPNRSSHCLPIGRGRDLDHGPRPG